MPCSEATIYLSVKSSIICSHARALVAQLVRASDWNLEHPGSNPGWIQRFLFFSKLYFTNLKAFMNGTALHSSCITANTNPATANSKMNN